MPKRTQTPDTSTRRVPPYSAEKVQEIREAVAGCKTWKEAKVRLVEVTGSHPDNVTRMDRKYGFWRPSPEQLAREREAVEVPKTKTTTTAGGEFVAEVETSVPKTLDEVVKLTGIDLEQWQAHSFGLVRKKSGYGWSARFVKRKDAWDDAAVSRLVSAIESCRPDWSGIRKVKAQPTDSLYLLGLVDTHIGKLAHGDETGWDDYDRKIAIEEYRNARDSLMARAKGIQIGRILLPVGNDLLHVDSQLNQTTGGTPQDVDGRVHKLFTTATALMIETIELLAKDYPVDVVVVRSNHDYNTIFYLGEVLKARFHGHPNVTINNAPTSRKYYRHGKNLLAFTHGDSERHESLPLTMANESKNDWAGTDQRFWICGHVHREIVKDLQGVRIIFLPSLSSADSWHAKSGYVGSIRAAMGLLFDATDGLIAQYYHTSPSISRHG